VIALRHRLQQIRVLGVAGRQRRQVLGELEQQLKSVTVRKGAEIVSNLL